MPVPPEFDTVICPPELLVMVPLMTMPSPAVFDTVICPPELLVMVPLLKMPVVLSAEF